MRPETLYKVARASPVRAPELAKYLAFFDVFRAAVSRGCTLVTENVADLARIAAGHLTTGGHHPGVLIALSSRFSRRPAGRSALVKAILAADPALEDRVVYLVTPEAYPATE